MKKSILITLIILVFIAIFIWSAFDNIPQWGIGLFLFVLIGDIIFSGFIEWLYRMIAKIIKKLRSK